MPIIQPDQPELLPGYPRIYAYESGHPLNKKGTIRIRSTTDKSLRTFMMTLDKDRYVFPDSSANVLIFVYFFLIVLTFKIASSVIEEFIPLLLTGMVLVAVVLTLLTRKCSLFLNPGIQIDARGISYKADFYSWDNIDATYIVERNLHKHYEHLLVLATKNNGIQYISIHAKGLTPVYVKIATVINHFNRKVY
ncbi:hypothetical protein [Chitinophaga flava]|uniref:Uncharacterized protein n=1 Tax=Chitinophaga flava TaxID=2259036 RepID=A0A365Y193_9BACT|nr:hypothetical protein [Chitinophaga flava]RBL92379.1 hypothetical protein DF182_07265 [Chitinophaga flava]